MSSLPSLHLSATLRSITSPLEPKPRHCIHTTAACHPPRTVKTPTLYCYKKIISTLVTLHTTQPHLQFASSLGRASLHRSSTRCRCSLSLSSHVHRPSAQWHSRWWTSWLSFSSRTVYRHVNSHKNIFLNPAASRGLSTSCFYLSDLTEYLVFSSEISIFALCLIHWENRAENHLDYH
jgi:hypothetical protein